MIAYRRPIGIDTNILVRYILQDDLAQAARASRFIDSLSKNSPGYITLVTIAELFWVLDRTYRLTRSQFVLAMDELLDSEGIEFQDEFRVVEAINLFIRNATADFSDCLIARCSLAAGCESTMTFDKTAAKSAGMTLLN